MGISGIQSKIHQNIDEYLKCQKDLLEVDQFLAYWFQETSKPLYHKIQSEHHQFGLPLISSKNFHEIHDFSFASHLTFTFDDFSNEPHTDSDVSSFTFGMWLPIDKKHW